MIEQILQKHLLPESDFIYGFADLHGLLDKEFDGFPYAISIGKRLDDAVVNTITDKPTIEYYRHYRSINVELSGISERICNDLRKEKINCIGVFPTISPDSKEFEYYLKHLRYKVSHKMVGTRAGLGWIGKTDLFISTKFGPRIRLASILIDKPVKALLPAINKSRCGSCEVCVTKCLAQASNGILWDINTDRDVFFNAHKCRAKCKELGTQLIDKDALICGVCVAVCPQGRKPKTTN
jgi:epoxyqueuosine reductase